MFDQLEEVRSVARARAVEDFEFFTSRVLGLTFDLQLVRDAQAAMEAGEVFDTSLEGVRKVRFENALHAWAVVIRGGTIQNSPSETFEWLFPEALRSDVAA